MYFNAYYIDKNIYFLKRSTLHKLSKHKQFHGIELFYRQQILGDTSSGFGGFSRFNSVIELNEFDVEYYYPLHHFARDLRFNDFGSLFGFAQWMGILGILGI